MSSCYRKKRITYDVPGEAHFLTFSMFRRQPLLTRDRVFHWVAEAVSRSRCLHPFDLWAWVIMPEHVHLVIRPNGTTRIADVLKSMKQSVAKRAIYWLRRNAPDFLRRLQDGAAGSKRVCRFWQRGGGYDRNLRSVRDIHEKILYVHQNPVRRGLVDRVEDYEWSSARAWLNLVDEPLSIQRDTVPCLTLLDDNLRSTLME